jgi:deoxyribodipyrimidine photo-lyase
MKPTLVWFRRDLRLSDNPALEAALAAGEHPVCVYVHDESTGDWAPGAASAWWLHHSLAALQTSLQDLGSDLLILRGEPARLLPRLARELEVSAVCWNRCYEPASIERDSRIEQDLQSAAVEVRRFNGSLLREPWEVVKKDGTPYRVFTPFWKALQGQGPVRPLLPAPDGMAPLPDCGDTGSVALDDLKLLPGINWDRGFYDCWTPGEEGAQAALERFCDERLADYREQRDSPSLDGTSGLSPHLHFGELSPQQVWHQVDIAMAPGAGSGSIKAAESFLRQLAWRDFGYQLLYHFPSTPDEPLDERFERFPWRTGYEGDLRRWQRGRTGIPIVDAGMRQLWTSGWMHNRVRMIVASLLTKNLLIPWQEGARWFWDTLVDADLANNTLGWQWTAGCGADAAPYFRVFNPVLQGERFDTDGSYVRQWVPELAQLPAQWIHKPWEAPADELERAGVESGVSYPAPIVGLKESRARALQAWDAIK